MRPPSCLPVLIDPEKNSARVISDLAALKVVS
jgi:hypothetical protein